ncbi:Os07g0608900, partial [Oryza sativa Japonica Group]
GHCSTRCSCWTSSSDLPPWRLRRRPTSESSRIVARGIALDDSQLDDHSESDSSSIGTAAQPSPIRNSPSRSLSFSHLSRLRGRVHTLWEWVLRKWPSDCIIIYQSEQLAFVMYSLGSQ